MKYALLFTAFLLSTFCYSQSEGTYQGKVIDVNTEEAMIGVNVFLDGKPIITSDIDGNFSLDIPSGVHKVKFTYIGYENQEKSIEIVNGQTIETVILMSPSQTALDIVVVSAGKFEQDIGETTVSMEVLKPGIIDNKNTVAVDDVLRQVPGVSIVDNEPQIRSGSGYSFGAGSRVMILVDDLPILSGDAGRPTWGFLPTENVEQIEVIKGASSVLYGSAALSGAINIRTSYPGEKPETKIQFSQGVYSLPTQDSAVYWDGNAMQSNLQFLHKRKWGQLDIVAGANFLGEDGYLGPIISESVGDNGVIQVDTASSKFNPFDVNRYAAESRARANLNLRYHSKKHTGLSFGLNTNVMVGENLATLLWDNNVEGLYKAYSGSASRTKQTVSSLDPFIELLTENGSKHVLRGRWQSLSNDVDNNQGNFSDVIYGEYQYQQNFDSLGIKDFKMTAGGVLIDTHGESQLFAGENTSGTNDAANYAGYVQLDKKFFDRLTVSSGIRYEYFKINDEEDAKPVFRAGVNYQLAEETYIRGSFGQGFRFPTIAEKFIATAVGDLIIYPSPELEAETSFNAEIGIKQGFKLGNFAGYLDVAGFLQEYENYIEFTFGQWAPPTPENLGGLGFRSLNTGDSRISGIDVSLMGFGNIGEWGVSILSGYTFTNPITTTPDYVYATPFTPEFSLGPATYTNTSSDPSNNILKYRMRILWKTDIEFSKNGWILGASHRFNGHMQNIDAAFEIIEAEFSTIDWGLNNWREDHKRGDHIIDMRIGYKLNDHHQIILGVQNLLNREYAIRPLAIESPRLTTVQYAFKI